MKIALVYFLESTQLSSDPKKSVCQLYLSMVDDLETFNRFPWGSVVYLATLEQLQTQDLRAKYANYKEQLEAKGKKATYTLYRFPFTFMVCIFFKLGFNSVINVVNLCVVILYRSGASR